MVVRIRTYCTRGIWLTVAVSGTEDVVTVIKPIQWAGDKFNLGFYAGAFKGRLDNYTWKKGLPRVASCGKYPATKPEHSLFHGCCGRLYDTTPERRRNLEIILATNPSCKIEGYDYSDLSEEEFTEIMEEPYVDIVAETPIPEGEAIGLGEGSGKRPLISAKAKEKYGNYILVAMVLGLSIFMIWFMMQG